MVCATFNHHVPKTLRANLKWRKAIYRRIKDDPAFAEVIWEACARDPLFFINGFCWTYDPRRKPFSKLPFILYDPHALRRNRRVPFGRRRVLLAGVTTARL